MRQINFVLWLLCIVSTQAQALFLSEGYSFWQSLGGEEKAFYTAGIWDTISAYHGDPSDEAVASGLEECGTHLSVRASLAVEAMTQYYESNVAAWSDPPLKAFGQSIVRGLCLEYVNKQRKVRGLPEWSKGWQ
jgi:hypothetical protein